jgi:MFS family permease
MAVFNIFGSLLAGLISKKVTPLRAFRSTYLFWVIVCAPLAATNPDWTLLIISALLGLAGGMQMVFYWEIVEAVRPKGAPTAAIGWLWTFEGTALAIGAALSGYISEAFSPRYCLAAMSVCVLIGYLIISNGHVLLKSADRLPTQSEDEEAMNIALDKTN